MTRAGAIADHWDIVNIRDKEGRSTWPEKNSEEAIDETLSKISASAQQTEYFNNPVSEGEVFKELTWGKIPPLSKFKFLVAYGDPAPGENRSKKSSTKTLWLIGELDGVYYVIKGFWIVDLIRISSTGISCLMIMWEGKFRSTAI